VTRVVASAELAATTKALAAKIASSSPYVVAIGKAAFYRQLQMPQPLAYDYAQDVMTMNAQAMDAQEGMKAFLDKRPPKWCGR
jgi:enoyl-CoA hydratase/carnithine racemase